MATADAVARGKLIALAAQRRIGFPFRPQGRGVSGFDCLGLVLDAARAGGLELSLPRLPLRGHEKIQILTWVEELGLERQSVGQAVAGDILLSFPAARQAHLAIRTAAGFVEANAALRQVVERLWENGTGWHSAWRLPWESD